MVTGSADKDEDLSLTEEDLVPPLLRGLPQRRSHPDVDAVLGGEGQEGRDVAARGVAVREGQHVRGRRNMRVGELVPRLSTRHHDGTRHFKQVFKRIGDTVVDAVNKFLLRALAMPEVLEGFDVYRWGRAGCFLSSSPGFTLNTGSKC